LSFAQVQCFIILASRLKNDILLAQPSSAWASDPPEILLPTIATFLQNSCEVSSTCIGHCWEALRSTIWHNVDSVEDMTEQDFTTHGHPFGLCVLKALNWEAAEERGATSNCPIYSPLPVHSVHLYCNGLFPIQHVTPITNNDGIHTYYDGIPDVIQIGEHQFAEWRLIQLWITLMFISWTSATNCACLYDLSLNQSESHSDWLFGFMLTMEHIWDGFVLWALLEDCQQQSATLNIPHTGAQKDHFTAEICAQSLCFHVHSHVQGLLIFIYKRIDVINVHLLIGIKMCMNQIRNKCSR
ncbi:hypothetical protein L208DRAFT_1561138, partial [Tricholoma matsutake]